ncbi:CHAT domain-containing protein [Streptomyces murinus]|uniref:CHAT domain-containing protein n=1 Tax=Streptomyces murinus TaxID=33900 RepID=UPI002E7FBCEF|nr:CHAT domain-containing protein [Streptomyces murinus]WUD08356.1 CHAT domain-containing protein [Streptomyces murinus]
MVSTRTPYEWTCERCGRPCRAPVWRIVDSRERADVLESPDGPDGFGPGLHWADCPGCGARAQVEAPVLVLRAGAFVPSLFATSVAELQRDATASAAVLVEEARVAGAFTGGRFGGNVVVLPRRLLPFALSRDTERDLADPEAACAELAPYGAPTVDNYRIFLDNVAAESAEPDVRELLYAVTVTMPDRLAELVLAHPRLTGSTLVRDAGARELREVAGTPLEAPLRMRQRFLEELCGGRVPVGTAVERHAAALAAFGQGLRTRLYAMYDQVRGAEGPEIVPLAREALELAGQTGESEVETELAARLGRLLLSSLYTADPADPAEAVRVLRLALSRLPEGTLQWAEVATDLASAQYFRDDGDHIERWETARDLLVRATAAVDRRTHGEFWARVQTNYGLLLGQRPGGGPDDLTLGIEHIRAGLGERARASNRVDRAYSLINLGLLLFRRGAPGDLKRAERCYRDALGGLRPDDDPMLWSQLRCNLADLLLSPERATADPRGAHAAVAAVVAFGAAHPGRLDTSRATWLLARTADLLDGPGSAEGLRLRRAALTAVPPSVFPSLHLSIAREAVDALAAAEDWDAAAEVASGMLTAAHALYDAQVTAAGRRGVLLLTRGTARQAAFLLARAGRPERAVEAIERGLARELSVVTGRDTVDLAALEGVDPLLAHRYRRARERYRVVAAGVKGAGAAAEGADATAEGSGTAAERAGATVEGPGAAPTGGSAAVAGPEGGSGTSDVGLVGAPGDFVAAVGAQAAAERAVRTVVEEIRAIPGFEGFLRTTEVADVVRAAGGMPLVYLVNAVWGSCVLVVPRDARTGVRAVFVPEVTSSSVVRLLALDPDTPEAGLFLAQQAGALARRRELPRAVDRLRELGPLLRPLAGLLAEDPRHEVVVVPTGLLGHVPLQAVPLGPAGELLDDLGTLTLAPSAGVYAASRAAAGRPPSSPPRLVAVADPDGSLPGARGELAGIRGLFEPDGEAVSATGAEATVEWLLARLAEASYLHLSCHGSAELVGRGASLALADGTLDLDTLVRLRLPRCRLVVAGACQSGRYDVIDAPDEFTGLPGGFLQAGAACVITSLWQVNDLATALLMTRLYELLAPVGEGRGEPPVSALRTARTWLRRLTWSGLARYTDGRPHLAALAGRYARPGPDPDECPFASPVHWAAFTAWGV